MEINLIEEEKYLDLFNLSKDQKTDSGFGKDNIEEDDTNMLSLTEETTKVPESDSLTETTTISDSTTETTTINTDIVADDKKPGRKPKYNFEDLSGYFEDRMKNGKFVAIEEEKEGKKSLFIPKTPEEYDEFIEIQVSTKLDEAKKEIEDSWFNSKTPAWKVIAKYSELVQNPSELIPFIQGVQNVQSVTELDPSNPDDAEQIVRIRYEQRGETKDIIDDQLESLKSTDKLTSTATKYKPLILQEESKALQEAMNYRKKEEESYLEMVTQIRDKAVEVIESPIFGKSKLKNEEKAAIYDLIATPSKESGGYKIYNIIDSLFEEGKFDLLAKVALLLTKEDSFVNHLSSSVAQNVAASLERKLRVSTEKSGSGDQIIDDPIPGSVPRKKFDSKFGY